MKNYIKLFCLTIFINTICLNAEQNHPPASEEYHPLTQASEEFLVAPTILSESEIIEGLKHKNLDMTWRTSRDDHFRFITKHEEVYFEIAFANAFPECFEEKDRQAFITNSLINQQTQNQFIYSYRWHQTEGEQINIPIKKDILKENSTAYLAHDRRIIEKSHPTILSEDYLKYIISDSNVVFYTGAGLSAASNIPTMAQLCKLTKIEEGPKFLSSLKAVIADPYASAMNIKIFHDACFSSMPTEAHYALKKLAFYKNTQIVTENLDYLHERTGIMPYRIYGTRLRNEVDPFSLNKVDFIICIGLSFDDRGFLGWYKTHHPSGKIIAIDLSQPSYLGDEDFLIVGDLQKIIPAIAQTIP